MNNETLIEEIDELQQLISRISTRLEELKTKLNDETFDDGD